MASKTSFFHSLISLIMLAAFCFLGYLWFNGDLIPRAQVVKDNLEGSSFLKTEQQFRDKLAELKLQRAKIERHISRLDKAKLETVEHLKSKGIKSSADLDTSDKDIKFALKKLQESRASIENLKKDIESYSEAITRIENTLDVMERKEITDAVKLSEEEFLGLQKTIVDLNERLGLDEADIFQEEEWAKILDAELSEGSDDSGSDE